ncbi:MAG: hypothetical protein CR982_07830 [Candidatus Cloacimonadota bacterium]|nr:MAG: hypothetical protein CR982_07830 [Candidatus Cloacimonadota bacterium]
MEINERGSMMIKNFKSFILLIALLVPGMIFAQAKTGTAAMTFLKLDVSARANALGGSYIGLGDDAASLFYNPASIIKIDGGDYIVNHTMYIDDINYTWAGATYPLKQFNAAMGVQFGYLNVGDMDETTPSNPTGTGRTFTASDMVVGLSYAQMLTTKFYVGGTLKFIHENLADESASTFAVDMGTFYDTKWKSLVFGMSMRNFGGEVKYLNEGADLPMMFIFGINFTPFNDGINKIDVAVEAAHPSDNAEYLTLGCEYSFEDMFFVRVGRKIDDQENWLFDETNYVKFDDDADGTPVDYDGDGFNLSGTSLGVGFKFMNVRFDYSWESYGRLGSINMFNIAYQL